MNIALIVGCARSGTSILGELIATHPDVKYIFEAHEVWELGGHGENGSHRLTAKHATAEVTQKIHDWFESQGPARLLLEKTPRNVLRVPYVLRIFPRARLIHIVRDGRDVACSMVPGIGGKEWSHLKPPSWEELMARYEGAVRCAYAWKEIMEFALADLATVPHLQIRYEDLIRNPAKIAQMVLEYLELDAHPSVYDFCENITNMTKNSYHAKIQNLWYREDHRLRIGRWRENLSGEEQRVIHSVLKDLLVQLGYGPFETWQREK